MDVADCFQFRDATDFTVTLSTLSNNWVYFRKRIKELPSNRRLQDGKSQMPEIYAVRFQYRILGKIITFVSLSKVGIYEERGI